MWSSQANPQSPPLPRRAWLRRIVAGSARWSTVSALAAGSLSGPGTSSASRAEEVDSVDDVSRGFVDSHVHIWTPDTQRYPLAAGWTVDAMQPPSFTAEQLLAHARPAGVSRIVLVQMSFYGTDNRYLLDAIAEHPGVFGGIAVIDPQDRPRETMAGLRARGVRGFRLVGRDAPAEQWLFTPGVEAMWRAGAELRQAMCLLVNPDALEPIDQMCTRFPKTPVVIDHMARIGVDGELRDRDIGALCHLARHPEVRVKVSAFYALGRKQPPYLDLAPMIRRLRDAFGAERLMWGTDCPYQVEVQTYADSLRLVCEGLDFLSGEERDWLLRRTASGLFFV